MSAPLSPKRIVIIGNGWAGSRAAAELAKKPDAGVQITVITPQEYQEVSLRMTKAVAAGKEEHDKALYPLAKSPGVTYVIGEVSELLPTSLKLKNGDVLQFDAALIASGTRIPIFLPGTEHTTIEARQAEIAGWTEKIAAASTIVVSGGGAVAVEIAADIKIRNKAKAVTLVANSGILPLMPKAFQERGAQYLRQQGIDVIVGDRVPAGAAPANGSIALASGKQVPCDLFIPATVAGPNSDFVPAEYKDARGFVKVDETLKVTGHPGNVFALGDVTTSAGGGGVPHLIDQSPTVLKNLLASLKGAPLVQYKMSFPRGTVEGPMLVVLGHGEKDGLGLGPNLPGCFCTWCCFVCPCFGGPCALPAGAASAKAKSDYNYTNWPSAAFGMSEDNKDASLNLSVHALAMKR